MTSGFSSSIRSWKISSASCHRLLLPQEVIPWLKTGWTWSESKVFMFVLRCCRRVEASSSGCLRAKSFKDSSVTIGRAGTTACSWSHQPCMKVVKGNGLQGRLAGNRISESDMISVRGLALHCSMLGWLAFEQLICAESICHRGDLLDGYPLDPHYSWYAMDVHIDTKNPHTWSQKIWRLGRKK